MKSQKNLLILACSGAVATGSASRGSPSIGACDSSGNQFSIAASMDPGLATSNTQRRHDTGAYHELNENTAGSIRWEAVMSLITNGFSLDYSSAPGSARKLLGIAIEVPNAVVKPTYDHPTSTGSQEVTGAGFTPKCVLEFTADVTADDTFADDARFGIGAATGSTEEGATWSGDEDGQGTTDTDRLLANNACVVYGDHAQADVGRADFTSFGADGHTKNWSVAPGTTRKGACIWLGDLVGSIELPPVTANIFKQSIIRGTR